jgi:hypothetical protein
VFTVIGAMVFALPCGVLTVTHFLESLAPVAAVAFFFSSQFFHRGLYFSMTM